MSTRFPYTTHFRSAVGAPIGELVDLGPRLAVIFERRNVIRLGLVGIARGDLLVNRFQQRGWIAEIAIEIDLGEEQRQVLEILPDDRRLAAGDAALIQALSVLDDVLR